jgi:hypothetical protein
MGCLRTFDDRVLYVVIGKKLIVEEPDFAFRPRYRRHTGPDAPEFGLREFHPEQQMVSVPLPTDDAPEA